MSFGPVAIVGQACVLPGALHPDELWRLVADSRVVLGPAPAGRWRVDPALVLARDGKDLADRSSADRGGYVERFERVFDAAGFAIPADEIAGLDPLFHWLLHAGRQALGHAQFRGERSRCGVVIGNLSYPSSALSRFAEHAWLEAQQPAGLAERLGLPPVDARNRFMSGLPAHLLARALGLGAGAFALDAACASSLYAIKLACDVLADGQADLMLAGAVNRADDLFLHQGFTALGALSPSGQSRPFHAEADGLLPAEGAALFALRRLADAQRDGDRILGVIRGIGLSNDGRGRGLLVPSQEGQVRALRAAYQQAELEPADISFVECHATGTSVGDAVEVRTLAEVFTGRREPVAVGSLKANLGHLITAAGAAGIVKVLAAMRAGVLPATPSVGRLNPALEGAPLRVLARPEPWNSNGPRRAAVSAFGFGGNNAHLILEEATGRARSPRSEPRPVAPAVAIVALGARVAEGKSAADFAERLFSGGSAASGPGAVAREIELELKGLRFPPKDLGETLPQQLLLLAAAREAVEQLASALPRERTSVLVGMQCDAEIARHGARWRLPGWGPALGAPAGWVAAAREAFVPLLGAAGVIGAMPNIVTNRLNSQFDLGGPSLSVSGEELSGTRALQLARRALEAGEIDAAVVGAVDVCAEPVHLKAAAAILPAHRQVGGDAAVVLVLKRLDDARRDGDKVLAVLGHERGRPPGLRLGHGEGGELHPPFGHAHAASGLLHIAAAALCCGCRALPGRTGAIEAWQGRAPRTALVETEALGGQRAETWVEEPPAEVPRLLAPLAGDAAAFLAGLRASARPPEPPLLTFPAHRPQPALPPLTAGATPVQTDPVGAAAAPVADAQALAAAGPIVAGAGAPAGAEALAATGPIVAGAAAAPHAETVQLMAPAPALPPVEACAAAPFAATAEHRTPASPLVAPSSPAALPAGPLGAIVARSLEHRRRVAQVHRHFLAQQAALHQQFLAGRARAVGILLGRTPDGAARSCERHDLPAARSAPRITPGAAGDGRAGAAGDGRAGAAGDGRADAAGDGRAGAAGDGRAGAAGDGRADAPADGPRGPAFSRAELEIHAAGRISQLFGPEFAGQDEYAIRVRMPEPPLLLADRVTGIDAVPNSMGLGTVWTESDVRHDSWFVNRGFMPAGIMIEAGQADLFLISYLGIDRLNQGRRAYRLLGCELTYHGSLPRVGDTLRYAIRVDGHARQADVRLFFFHYDCLVGERPALTVRQGQAGFFTREELDDSAGVLWSPEEQKIRAEARLDPPAVACTRRQLSAEQVRAFAAGDLHACFGPGFEAGQAHVRTPAIQNGKMLLVGSVRDLDPTGGPWHRGYLRAHTPISPDDWFFAGHFKNDPCMPGTLMFEGCLQMMAIYLAGLGYTLNRDGWRFEPVPEETYKLQCRGQVLPTSKDLVCEMFVEEVHDGPLPTVYADLLGTVDGLKAFHARRVGLRLVPDWLLDSSMPELRDCVEPKPVASVNGFAFDYRSLLACAWGKPSEAFGPMYAEFDGPRRVARLPGPPYHFMSRVVRVDGEMGARKPGAVAAIEYDVPARSWYFDESGALAMPYCVLLEAVLQPCGWLASFVGGALGSDEDLAFRNLDGTGRVLAEVPPGAGPLATVTTLKSISRSGSMVLVGFDVRCTLEGRPVYELETGFGFFPASAFENQTGLPVTPEQAAQLATPSDLHVDLTARPERYFAGSLRLPGPMLLMLDRVTAWQPAGGRAGKGWLRAEKDVSPAEWFFKAHFFQDPVQPGSLGLEAMIQLLQFHMLHAGLGEGMHAPRFVPIENGRSMTWKYRGQVVPRNRLVSVTMDIVEQGRDATGALAVADASLWVDGKRIYEANGVGMRILEGEGPTTSSRWNSGSAHGPAEPRSPGGEQPAPRPVGPSRPPAGHDHHTGQATSAAELIPATRDYWRTLLGAACPPVEDICRGLILRFLRQVHIEDPASLDVARERGAIFLGNHQVMVESTVFAIVASGLLGRPLLTVARIENQEQWLDLIMRHAFAHPGLRSPRMSQYFDRGDRASLPGIIREMSAEVLASGRSVMVHVEGAMARACRRPVHKLSSAFIDMAFDIDRPIVPVRFTGGLPVQPVAGELDFPVGMGRQDIHLGRALAPAELRGLNYRERRERVLAALNRVGPPLESEEPSPADPAFRSAAEAWAARTGAAFGHAVLLRVLADLPDPSPEIASLVAASTSATLHVPATAAGRWLAELARRLFGPRGPAIAG